jgi:hypothetical protein
VITERAFRAGGALLAAATRGVAAVRRADKPLHPRGDVVEGRLDRSGSTERTGVPWLDEPGTDDVTVRRSRAIGLPRPVPDVHGLALRVHTTDGLADLLFASTGLGRLTRFVLTAGRDPRSRPLTTLLPYETDTGPVILAAVGLTPQTYELSWARADGDWRPFAVLRLASEHGADQDLSFDPVRHQVAGLRQYPGVRRLREPAYHRARRSSGRPEPDDVRATRP